MNRKGKNAVFKRGRLVFERKHIFTAIKSLASKYEPVYDGKIYLEKVRCCFFIPMEKLEKYRYTYEGKEAYAFLLSNKMILSLYTLCAAERRDLALTGHKESNLSAVERRIVKLENIKEVVFQTLLLDTVRWEKGMFLANFCTVFLLD